MLTKKLLTTVLLLILTLAILLAGAYLVMQKKSKTDHVQIEKNESEKKKDEIIEVKDGPEYSPEDQTAYLDAMERKDQEKCAQISNRNNRDLCYRHLALAEADPGICALLLEQTKISECEDDVIAAKAFAALDFSLCEEIKSDDLKRNCRGRIMDEKDINESDCQKIPLLYTERTKENQTEFEPRDICVSKALFRLFAETEDSSVCEKMPACHIKASCLAQSKGLSAASDNDKDGLKFSAEICYGSDPDNPDTDGDGYSDGEEVKNDFYPTGGGRMYYLKDY